MNENYDETPHRPGRRAATGASPAGTSTFPDFIVPPAPETITAPTRRSQRAAAGYEVPPEYVVEVLAMPATIPAAGIPALEETVDFDDLIDDEAPADFEQMIADEAVPDFEKLAARETDEAFRSALLPPGAPAGSGGLSDFAVYGDPEIIRAQTQFPTALKAAAPPQPAEPEATPDDEPNPLPATAGAGGVADFAVYGEPEPAPTSKAAARPVDPDRDVGVTEAPVFYDDPSAQEVTHKIRFTPGKTLSLSNRRVYRADSRGIPIFSPGWTAKMTAAHYHRGFLINIIIAFVIVGVAAGLAYLAVGADSNYLAVKEKGVAVEATVASVKSDTQKNEKASTTDSSATTTQTASVHFTIDGQTYTRNITDTSSNPAAMIGVEQAWKIGDKVRLYADLNHTGQVLVQDDSQPGRVNWITLSPLFLAALFTLGASAGWRNARKFRQIAEVTD